MVCLKLCFKPREVMQTLSRVDFMPAPAPWPGGGPYSSRNKHWLCSQGSETKQDQEPWKRFMA